MSRASPHLRKFARSLVAYEASGNGAGENRTPAAFHASDRLRPHLAMLMGNGGFRALLSRALALASGEVKWLRAMRVTADGSLEGLEELYATIAPDEFSEGRVVLLAELLGLLVAFIGESLTLRLVREIWPKVPLEDLDFGNGGKNEKTK